MLNPRANGSSDERRDVDLYVHAEKLDALYARLKGHVDMAKEPHDTFYGMREFIVRDPNGFWVTFGEPRDAH